MIEWIPLSVRKASLGRRSAPITFGIPLGDASTTGCQFVRWDFFLPSDTSLSGCKTAASLILLDKYTDGY